MELKWTLRALEDVSNIVGFVERDKPLAAVNLAQTIKAKTESLREFPHLGRVVWGNKRELVIRKHYLITYRLRRDRVEILQVWNTAQDR
jgi:toxin ParE1/3/4